MESRWKRRFLFSNVVIYAISALAIVGSGYFKFGNSTDVLILGASFLMAVLSSWVSRKANVKMAFVEIIVLLEFSLLLGLAWIFANQVYFRVLVSLNVTYPVFIIMRVVCRRFKSIGFDVALNYKKIDLMHLLMVIGSIVALFASVYAMFSGNIRISYTILGIYICAIVARLLFPKYVVTTTVAGIATGLSLWLLSQYLSPIYNWPFGLFTILFVLMEVLRIAMCAKKEKEKLEFNRAMSSITKEYIMSDDAEPRDIVEPLFRIAEYSRGCDTFAKSLNGFSESQRLILAVEIYLDDVMFDGHKLFFDNHSGICPYVLAGLKAIEAEDYLAVFKNASDKYEKYYSKDEIIEASDVDFEAEDNFILSTVSIGYLEIHYIREHLDDFATVA